MAGLKAQDRQRDEPVWKDDYVEVFLIADANPEVPYHQFTVSPSGAILDIYDKQQSYNCKGLKVATHRGKDAWTVEIAIPFAGLHVARGKEKLKGGWRLSVNRYRTQRQGVPFEESAWSPSYGNSSKVPAMFGHISFGR